ncbi:MAG: OsmC family protein [Pseudomonadota bacterium]
MQAAELRGRQAPLKAKYKDDPSSARVTVRAEGIIDGEAPICHVPGWAGTAKAGLHPSTGGDGSEACSADMLLEALVACAGVTLKAVAVAMEIPLQSAKVIAEGTFDARGTLGVDKAAPVGLSEVTLRFEVESPADPAKLEKLVQLSERYCVIYQTLKNSPALTSEADIRQT